jgi:hypothetical protein
MRDIKLNRESGFASTPEIAGMTHSVSQVVYQFDFFMGNIKQIPLVIRLAMEHIADGREVGRGTLTLSGQSKNFPLRRPALSDRPLPVQETMDNCTADGARPSNQSR